MRCLFHFLLELSTNTARSLMTPNFFQRWHYFLGIVQQELSPLYHCIRYHLRWQQACMFSTTPLKVGCQREPFHGTRLCQGGFVAWAVLSFELPPRAARHQTNQHVPNVPPDRRTSIAHFLGNSCHLSSKRADTVPSAAPERVFKVCGVAF